MDRPQYNMTNRVFMSSSLERMWCENAMLLFVKSDAWSLISSTDLCRVARLPLKAWNNSSQLAITIHNQFKCNHTSKERWSTHKLYSNYFAFFLPLPPLKWIPLVMGSSISPNEATGWPWWSRTWVGLTWNGMFQHPVWALGSYSSGQPAWELLKSKSTEPRSATTTVTL